MSLIGSLEQFSLSSVLRRIETHAKTGLLIVKQEERWVELSFRQGQLMCIGPVRPADTLGERLLQARVISQQASQEVAYSLGPSQYSETRTAITLIDLGYVNQESLYAWAAGEVSRVLQVLLAWSTGDVYFEEELQPPADRLLIALSAVSLLQQLSEVPASQPISAGTSSTGVQAQPKPRKTIPDPPTLHDASQFFDDPRDNAPPAPALFSSEVAGPELVRNTDLLSFPTTTLTPPQQATKPVAPMRIDTSFLQPQMVLTPTDLSALRERNPRIQLTPEQWRLFTRADGQTTLQMACQVLVMPSELVCQVAGELFALGLVTISTPASGPLNDPSPGARDFVNARVGNIYTNPGLSASLSQAPAAVMPATGSASHFSSPPPIETHSQWGNGGNGATFVLGGGWVVASSPPQPAQSRGHFNLDNRVYAQAGGMR